MPATPHCLYHQPESLMAVPTYRWKEGSYEWPPQIRGIIPLGLSTLGS